MSNDVAGPRTEKVVRSRDSEVDEDLSETIQYHPTVDVIIPTLNEEQTIEEIIDMVNAVRIPANVSMLVIDGGSTDSTLDICKRKNVRVVMQKGKGKGRAMREAVNQTGADIVVFIDGDGTYPVMDLGLLVGPLLEDKADMVVGARVKHRSEKGSILPLNALGNGMFNRAINFALSSRVADSLSGYRALHRKTFNELVLFSDKFEIEVEMTVEALAQGYRILEVPISYTLRKGSKAKLDPINDGARIARSLLFILMNVNPLKFFSLIALGFFVAGSYPAYYVLLEKFSTGEVQIAIPAVVLSSLLYVTGTISLVVGLLSELVVRSRRRLEYLFNKRINS
jgi:glycosyltransferase involved in cell wall biosynthesis